MLLVYLIASSWNLRLNINMSDRCDEIALWFFVNVIFAVVVEKVDESDEDDYGKLTKDLGKLSPPLEIITKAHEKLGDNIALAFRYFLSLSLWIFLLICQSQVVD
jgi:hypothetical protein